MGRKHKTIIFALLLILFGVSLGSAANVTADFSTNVTEGNVPLTVSFTDLSTNATSWQWNVGDGTANYTTQNITHMYNSAGTYTITLTATGNNESATAEKPNHITVNPAPVLPGASFEGTPTSGTAPLTVQFNDLSSNATSWQWNFGDASTNSTEQSPSHIYSSEGTYTVTLTAVNANGTSTESKLNYITVSSSVVPPVASFTANVTEGSAPLSVAFTDTSTGATSWQWNFGDGSANSTEKNPTHTFNSTGTYNVVLTAINDDGSSVANKTIKVQPKNYFSGDRIWDASANQSTTYTWNAKSFSGFFYDLDSGFSSETMTITGIARAIGNGNLLYRTEPVESDFERSAWGKYQVIGFMAEKYFAGYTSTTTINGVNTVSLISSGQLSKVLIDNDDRKSVYSGSSLTLEEGYRLNIVQVDRTGNKVLVTLTKDGKEVDSSVIEGGRDYVYKTDLGDSQDVVLIAVRFDSVFSGTESNAVFIQGMFQISEDYVELEDGAKYGKMKITGFSNDYIEMKNDGSFTLTKGRTIPVMGKINFIVADSDTLRFAPYVDMSSPGKYELRGTVAEDKELLTWTPLNFEGFYYDINEGIQTEKLELREINGRTIPKDKLVYTSTPADVSFERSSWGNYKVIGFMADKYFAGYPSNPFGGSGSSVDILSGGLLSKVLIDEDSRKSVYSGSSLILEEGYTLNIVQVDRTGDKVLVTLTKDGKEVDTAVLNGRDTYIYEKDLGDADNVPLIAVYFDSIFSGTESNAVFIQGIFQISEDYLELEDGDTFGRMEITSTGGSITMSNKDSISLTRGRSVSLMGDVSIKVADSGTVRYYPYVEVTTTPSQTLSVKLDNPIVTQGGKVTVTVTSRGAAVSDATVKAGTSTIGKTGDEGTLVYTASTIGKLKITAEKEGYASGSSELEVISPDDDSRKIIIEVSPEEVYEGSSVTFFVLKAIGGDAIEGATVSYDGKSIGSTSSDGTVTYTVTNYGVHKLTAVKSGFLDASMNLEVKELAAKFEFTNLAITPLDVKQGKEATISVDVKNVGTAAGNYTVDLKVNDTVVGTKTVSLGIGESETLEFKHAEKEPGTYVVKVADLTTTYEVFEKSGVIWYVLGAIAVVVVGGLGYLFTAGGWTAEIAQAKVDEAIQTLQELVSKR